ncbi:MAG: SGNH/GDSL hydrolase family protein [Dehalococcoidia bacterium]
MRTRLWQLVPLALLFAAALVVPACGGSDDDASSPSTDGPEDAGGSPDPADPTGTVDPADPAAVRYLAIGDSLSQGVGADDIETGAFPARLAERWRAAGCTVELNNAGISGYTASQMIEEQVPKIREFKPTVITFQSGANDIANGISKKQYRDDVGTVLDAALKSGARVYVLLQNEWFRAPAGPDYGGTRELRDAYDEIMIDVVKAKKDVTIVDLRPLYEQQADRNEWIDDGIHPTAKAYDAWSERLVDLIPRPCDN